MKMIRSFELGFVFTFLLASTYGSFFNFADEFTMPDQLIGRLLARRRDADPAPCPFSVWNDCTDDLYPLASEQYEQLLTGQVIQVDDNLLDNACRIGREAITCMEQTIARCPDTLPEADTVAAINFVCSDAGREAALAANGSQCDFQDLSFRQTGLKYQMCVNGTQSSFLELGLPVGPVLDRCLVMDVELICTEVVIGALCGSPVGRYASMYRRATDHLVMDGMC